MQKNVLLIGAHPDDIEIGMGGTAAALVQDGHTVIAVDLTDGEPTPHGSPEIRAKESAKAAKILGIEKRICLGLTNREVFDTVQARKQLASLMREFRPEILFIPYWEDGHPDHIQAEALATAARFYSKFVKTDMPHTPHLPRKTFHYYCSHIRNKLVPSFIFDISKQAEKKFSSLEAYQSQFSGNPNNSDFLNKLKIDNQYWGAQIGTAYGEPFMCRETIRFTTTSAILDG